MAIRGRKPSATILRLLAGNPGHRPIPQGEPEPAGGQSRRASGAMTDPGIAAEGVYAAIVAAGDVAFCLALERYADETGKNGLRHAVATLRGSRRAGRKGINDRGSLQRIEASQPEDRREAAGREAGRMAGAGATDAQIEAIAQRLRRKLRMKRTN